MILVAALVLGINFAPVAGMRTTALSMLSVALAAGVAFAVRQLRARFPLFDLRVARRRIFWVAAVAGIVVFGTLMGPCSSDSSSCRTCSGTRRWRQDRPVCPPQPSWWWSPRSPRSSSSRTVPDSRCCWGTRRSSWDAGGAVVVEGGRAVLEDRARLHVARSGCGSGWYARLAFADRVGAGVAGGNGVGHRGPAARPGRSHRAVGARRAAHRRVRGVLAAAIAAAPQSGDVGDQTQTALEKSFAGAENVAERYPQYADAITAAARAAFSTGTPGHTSRPS